ncbi:MAB_1171c family putative transporter [Streptomyces sp. CB02923]|uniref:MAB_1171c family putative transporter n=1 Tax=Streptomyces sp. CB02923 TaxID=1718985 RepID=UPI000B16CC9E|nr:MAB_1171c family putative transporter [Streptomyces sp. CB02923]
MDTLSLYELGTRVELIGALVLWLVIILRLPAARRSRQQRMLLIAVIGIAGSVTVYLDPVTAALNHSLAFAESCGLFMNAWGVLSSALILDFVLAAIARRCPWLVYVPMVVTIAALIVLNYTIAPHAGCVTAAYVPWYSPFWWILVAAHLVGTVPCTVLCVRYARRVRDDRSLRAGLVLLAAGFASSSVFWGVVFVFLLARPAWLGALFPLNIGITAWLMAAGASSPLVIGVLRTVRDACALWRLRPLWDDLTKAVPHVTLGRSVPRLRAVIGSPHAIHLRLYRQVIEIRDTLLILQDYASPEVMARARQHITTLAMPEDQREPATTACWLQAALRAVATGGTPRPNPLGSGHSGKGDRDSLRSEIDFLLAVSRARTLPAVLCFTLPSAVPGTTTPDGDDRHAPATPAK